MAKRMPLIVATAVVVLATTPVAQAATGDLTFSRCLQGMAATSAACTATPYVDRPTDMYSSGQTVGLTNAGDNSYVRLNALKDPTPVYYGQVTNHYECLNDGVLPNCVAASNMAIDDPEGLGAAEFLLPPAYVAGAAHDTITEIPGVLALRCAAQGGAFGCTEAHGLHH